MKASEDVSTEKTQSIDKSAEEAAEFAPINGLCRAVSVVRERGPASGGERVREKEVVWEKDLNERLGDEGVVL